MGCPYWRAIGSNLPQPIRTWHCTKNCNHTLRTAQSCYGLWRSGAADRCKRYPGIDLRLSPASNEVLIYESEVFVRLFLGAVAVTHAMAAGVWLWRPITVDRFWTPHDWRDRAVGRSGSQFFLTVVILGDRLDVAIAIQCCFWLKQPREYGAPRVSKVKRHGYGACNAFALQAFLCERI